MPNQFYADFDFATIPTRKVGPSEHRTPFQIDRDRIIHTSAFRSLQSKTQVFLSGEYDFYRTRLTHTIEVAQIGRSICSWLDHSTQGLGPDYYIDADLVEAACLAHDIGHPPFGHCGERTLNQLMQPWGGFEGNAQTLRILTESIFTNGGMQPTRALLDGVLKYKTLHGELNNPPNHFLYDHQTEYLDFVLEGRDFPVELPPGKTRDGFRSIECQIMDWADDTAYSLNDVADGIHAGFITIERLEKWAAERDLTESEQAVVHELLEIMRKPERIESRTGKMIGKFISASRLVEDANFMSAATNRHRYRLEIDPEVEAECEIHKKISLDLVFRSRQLQQLDYKATLILQKMFGVLAEYYIEPEKGVSRFRILSAAQERQLEEAPDAKARARLVCDYFAAMTDGLATRTYKRLFEADSGSIVDLV